MRFFSHKRRAKEHPNMDGLGISFIYWRSRVIMKIFCLLGILLFSQQTNSYNPIIVQQEGKTIAIEDRSDFILPIPGGPFINLDYFNPLLNKLTKESFRKPINATIDEHGRIHPETIGYKLDRSYFTKQLYNSLFHSGSSIIDAKKIPIYPQVDSEILSNIQEKRIGQYLTFFNASNKERSFNIQLAANAINNHVVFPGQTFSFNKVVGKRTEQKGYLPAPIIVKGELAEGIGGGICQVSSTLFNAVDNSGLKIVQRYSHSKSVRYVPHGRDATVSWYGPDFKFMNKYNQPILIKARTYEGKLIVSIYSSDLINFKPRKIPSASKQLPVEIKVSIEPREKSPE
jgi:vancomycin resistance protein YoaR